MKKRRTLIISLLLVAALALGVGYAALSQDLLIKGSANLNPDSKNFDVIFTNSTATGGTSTAAYSDNTADYNVAGIDDKGEEATFVFTVENANDDTSIKAYLTGITQQTGTMTLNGVTQESTKIDEYFDKEVVITGPDGTYTSGTEFCLDAGETATVTITVTLKKVVTDPLVLSGASVTLHFADRIS